MFEIRQTFENPAGWYVLAKFVDGIPDAQATANRVMAHLMAILPDIKKALEASKAAGGSELGLITFRVAANVGRQQYAQWAYLSLAILENANAGAWTLVRMTLDACSRAAREEVERMTAQGWLDGAGPDARRFPSPEERNRLMRGQWPPFPFEDKP